MYEATYIKMKVPPSLCAPQDEEDQHDHVADIEAELGIEIDREDHQGAHSRVRPPLPLS